jgi:hypothetical protein
MGETATKVIEVEDVSTQNVGEHLVGSTVVVDSGRAFERFDRHGRTRMLIPDCADLSGREATVLDLHEGSGQHEHADGGQPVAELEVKSRVAGLLGRVGLSRLAKPRVYRAFADNLQVRPLTAEAERAA